MFCEKQLRRGGMHRSGGFTIIEVIAAIIILGILASLSVNMMQDYKLRQNVDSSRQQFINAITMAVAAAAKYNVSYSVVYESANHNVLVCATPGTVSPEDDTEEVTTVCNVNTAAYYADLTMFANSCPTANGNTCLDIPSSSATSGNRIVITPFGKIMVDIAGVQHDDTGKSAIFFQDGKRQVITAGSKLCLGILISENGAVDTVDYYANSTGGCGV